MSGTYVDTAYRDSMSKQLSFSIIAGLIVILMLPQTVHATTPNPCLSTSQHPTTLTIWWTLSGIKTSLTNSCTGQGIVRGLVTYLGGPQTTAGLDGYNVTALTQSGGQVTEGINYQNGTSYGIFAFYFGNSTYAPSVSNVLLADKT